MNQAFLTSIGFLDKVVDVIDSELVVSDVRERFAEYEKSGQLELELSQTALELSVCGSISVSYRLSRTLTHLVAQVQSFLHLQWSGLSATQAQQITRVGNMLLLSVTSAALAVLSPSSSPAAHLDTLILDNLPLAFTQALNVSIWAH